MNRVSVKIISLALVFAMLMTTATPLLSSNVSGGSASEGSATLAGVGPDGKPYKDPADYTVVPVFNIDSSDASSHGMNEIQYLTQKTLSYTSDPLYKIDGDGSPEDPFVVKDLWFEGSPEKWQGRFVWQGVLYNWVFINCVFESQVTLNANRNLQASGSTPTALSFEDCTFYSVPAGIEISQSGAGLNIQGAYLGNPLGTAALTFKNNVVINIDPFTGITGAVATGLRISSTFATATIENNFIDGGVTTGTNTRVIAQNNTLPLNSAKPGPYSGDLYLNGCSNGTIISNNSVASIQPIVSAASVTVRIYDNIIDGEGKKAQGISLSSSTPNNLGKNFYVYNNAISNTTSEGIYGNLNGGGTIRVYSNYLESTVRGFRDNYPLKTVIERFDSNTFVNAWSVDPVVKLTYEKVVTAVADRPISWTYREFIESSKFSAAHISADGGVTWTRTDDGSTSVNLGAEEKWYNFLLSVTDTEDNQFIESIDIAHDLSPPVVTFIAPLEGKTLRTNTLRVFYETIDLSGVTKAKIKLDNGAWIERADANFNGYTFTAAQGASRGAHTITVYVEDAAGNGKDYTVNFVFRPMGEGTVIAQGSIVLDGNDDLSNYARFAGLSGSGTADEPYVLKGLNLDCGGGVGITIKNTDKHLRIYDIEFFNGVTGICLDDAANVEVKECIFHSGIVDGVIVIGGSVVINESQFLDCENGIVVDTDGGSVLIQDNLFNKAGTAIDLEVDNGVLDVIDNDIMECDMGIYARTTSSTVTVSANHMERCGVPMDLVPMPDVFTNNEFVLNDEGMVDFTFPDDGSVIGEMTVECEYTSTGLTGAVSFEASNDMISWTAAVAGNHVFGLGKEGVNTLYIRGTDADDNSVITSMTVVRDTTPPTVSVVLPQSDLTLKANYLPFRWTASDVSGISSVTVKLDDDPWVAPDGANNHTFRELSTGPHTISVNVTDNLGHSTVVTASFEVASDDRPSGPVVINGNDSLRQNATLLGWTGTGTESDPFKVGMFHPSLSISNTDLYIDICDMSGVGNITLTNVKHVAIRNIEMAYSTTLTVDGFEDLVIENNNLTKMTHRALGGIDGVQTYSSVTITNGKDLIIENNRFNFTVVVTGFMSGYFNLMTFQGVDNANISDNILSTTSTAVSYAIRGVVFQGTNSIIEGNTMTLLRNGGIVASGTNLNISNNNIVKCSSDPYYFGAASTKRISPAISASGEGITVFNNVVKESTGSMPSNGGPGIRASGSVNVSSNTIATFRLGMLINDGAVAWNNVITDCRVGMSGNGVMRHNTVSAMYGVAPTAGAMIEGNDIDVTEFGIYCEFYYIIDLSTSGTVTDLANDVTMTNNHFKAKVGVNIDDKAPADTDIISGLKMKGNTFDCTEAAIRIVGASLVGAEISSNMFNGAGFTLVNIGSSTFGVDFKNNVFSGVAADSLISFVKPAGAVTPQTIVNMRFNGSLFGLSAIDQGCRLSVDGSNWFTMSNDGLLLLDPSVPDGMRTLNGELKDNKGNTFVASMDIVFDSEAPIIEMVSPGEGETNPSKDISVQWTVTDQGTGHINSVRIKLGNEAWSTANLVSGLYSKTFFSLDDGTYTFTIEATDDQGHVTTVTRTFVIDVLDPVVTIVSPSDSDVFGPGSVTVEFEMSDAGSGIESTFIRINGGDWLPASGRHTFTGLGGGTHVVEVMATDNIGRESTAAITVVVDATAPTLVIESPSSNAMLNDGKISIDFDAGDATRIEARVNNGVWKSIPNEAYALDLVDGIYTVSIRVFDAVGNVNETSVTFVVDTAKPSVSISSPTNSKIVSASVLDISFSAGDSNGMRSLVLSIDGIEADVTGRTSYRLSSLSEGPHVIVLTATDAAGNVASTNALFVVDTTAPTLTISSPTTGSIVGDGEIRIVFDAGDATRVEARVNNGVWSTIENEAYALNLDDGIYTVSLRAYDAVGNVNETSVTFVVDTTAPTVMLINPAAGATVDKAEFDVFFTVTDASAIKTVMLAIDGRTVNVTDVRAYGLSDLSDGTHTLVFSAVDILGNEASYTFELIVSVPVTISGRIVDGDGSPLVGAVVKIGTASATTDSDGRYSLVTARGEKSMIVTADGMSDMTQSIDLTNEQASFSMVMKSSSGGDNGSMVIVIVIAIVIMAALLAGVFVLRRSGKL